MKDVVEMMVLNDQWYVHPSRRSNDVPRRLKRRQRDVVTGHGITYEEASQKLGMVHGELTVRVKEEGEE